MSDHSFFHLTPTEHCDCDVPPEVQAAHNAAVSDLGRYLHRAMTRYCRTHDDITNGICLDAAALLTFAINWRMDQESADA